MVNEKARIFQELREHASVANKQMVAMPVAQPAMPVAQPAMQPVPQPVQEQVVPVMAPNAVPVAEHRPVEAQPGQPGMPPIM